MRIWKSAALPFMAAVILGLLSACALPKLNPADDAAVRRVFTEIQTGDIATLQANATSDMKGPDAAAQLQRLHALVPQGQPKSVTTTGYSRLVTSGQGEMLEVVQDYDFGDRVALVDTSMTRAAAGQGWVARGINVRVATRQELAAHAFTLQGKPASCYLALAALAASLGLMIAALVKVIRTRGLKRKWLWGILSFIGLFSFHVNWTNGAWLIQWITVQIIGLGVVRGASPFSDWIVTFTLPLGALLILFGVVAKPPKIKPPAEEF